MMSIIGAVLECRRIVVTYRLRASQSFRFPLLELGQEAGWSSQTSILVVSQLGVSMVGPLTVFDGDSLLLAVVSADVARTNFCRMLPFCSL